MAKIDMSGMSDETRMRFEELKRREAADELSDIDRDELMRIRSEFGISGE